MKMKMKKYVFDKSIYLGLIKKNFNAGDTIELSEKSAIVNGEEITDLRDIMICLKKNYLIPFAGSVYDKVVEIKEEVEDKIKDAVDAVTDTFFGFKIQNGDGDSEMIPLSKYTKTTEISEDKVFAEENGVITEATGIHVAPAISKTEINDKTAVEPTVEEVVKMAEEEKKTEEKTTTKKTTKKTTAKKDTVKKDTVKKDTVKKDTAKKASTKKSKIVENMEIKTEEVAGEVRGMKVIKGE